MIFTDLDGTLLDHGSYSHAPAEPALRALRAQGIPLILASSKTAAEIAPLRAELGFAQCPAIVENGAAILDAGHDPTPDASDYRKIRQALDTLPTGLRRAFRGFGDMTAHEVAETTGLSTEAARLAQTRQSTEPGLLAGDDTTLGRFLDALRPTGITARQGGRFLTLTFGRTKADQMRRLIARNAPVTTIALGDAPNDIEMLEAADHGVIIRNDHAAPVPQLAGETEGRITRTTAPGPTGWNLAVLHLLSRLGPNESEG